MFGLMTNCFSWLKGQNKPPRDVKLIIIGLDDAGKTTTVACLQGEPPDGITPTIGFSNASFKFGKWNVTLYDLGGGSSVRSVWQKYYAEIYGILFTVDSGNQDRLTESKNVLSEIFEDPKVSGKPIVVFANKQDKEGALDEKKVTEELTLQQLSEKHKFKFNVFPCSAIKGYGKQTDQTINTGILWLLEAINQDYSIINDKVEKESAVQKEIEAIERKARLERIRKLREEREIAAKEAGVGEEEEFDDNLVQGNPFRNINDQIEVTAKREKKAKENMKKIKAHQAKQKDIITNETENVEEVPIKKKRKKKKKNVAESNENENTNNDNENDISLSQNSGVSVESMVAKRRKKKKKKKVTENYEINEVETIDEESEITLSKKKTTVCNSDDDFCEDLSNMNIKTKVRKKKKTHEENDDDDDDDDGNVVVNTKGTQVIVVSSVESVRPKKPVRKKKTNANASDNAIERDINNSLPHDVKRKKKKKVIRVSDEEEETIKTKQEVVNNSRAELFQVKSYDSLQGSAMLENNTSKQKRRRKKKKEIEEEDNDIPVEKPIRKKKKKKNKTAPTLTSSPVHDNESDIWNTPPDRNVLPQISQNGHISKLSPIKLRGRLPVIGSENSSVPSWAQARPNSDDLDVMV